MPLKRPQLGVRSSAQNNCAPTRALRIAEQNNLAAVAEAVSIIWGGRWDDTDKEKGGNALVRKTALHRYVRVLFPCLSSVRQSTQNVPHPTGTGRSWAHTHSPQRTTRHGEKHTAKFATPLTPRPPCTKTPPHQPPATATKSEAHTSFQKQISLRIPTSKHTRRLASWEKELSGVTGKVTTSWLSQPQWVSVKKLLCDSRAWSSSDWVARRSSVAQFFTCFHVDECKGRL